MSERSTDNRCEAARRGHHACVNCGGVYTMTEQDGSKCGGLHGITYKVCGNCGHVTTKTPRRRKKGDTI